MAITVTHTTTATSADQPGVEINKAQWNGTGAHTLAGSIALSEITLATGAVTLANGNNTGIVWNWANTTDSTIAFTFGETSAATGGTSTAGVPNQVLLKLTTLTASTQSPLSVYSRGLHVFSVSPTVAQILGTSGALANPTYAFAAGVGTGMYFDAVPSLQFALAGVAAMQIRGNQVSVPVGTAAIPAYTNLTLTSSGLFFANTGADVGFAVSGIENSRVLAGAFQGSKGSADAVSYAINARKSRGTVAAPTVITTGDALLTESGYGYVGGTNTYLEATRIEHDSTGTIADSTSGIGGIIKFFTKLAGTDTAVQEGFRLVGGSVPILQPPSNAATSLGTSAIGWKALYLDYTDTATVGNVTINKPSGQVQLGAGATTLTLTNSLITAKSHIFLSADSAPGNVVAVQFYAVAAAGSCTINAVPAVTNQTSIDFLVIGAD